MEPEVFYRVEKLFHAAAPLPTDERAALLDSLAQQDPALRAEVESLLAALDRNPEFMERAAFSLGMSVLAGNPGEQSVEGKTVGPYKVLRLLGRGGMGEVYLAEDERLGRKVALKFLAHQFVDDAWAKRQLVKEAHAAAQLDHPNICTVYGFEEDSGHGFMVMQYVEGETLDSLLRAKSLDADQEVEVARQIARALSEAHAHGLIHRDIKPQNIMITESRQVKMLDFGLAKIIHQKQGLPGAEGTHTQTSQLGFIPGTVAYMSPEQMRGERLDFRSDVFSFGTVLYELFGGGNPFLRESKAETISAVLNYQPPLLTETVLGASCEIERIIHKCLEKNRDRRYQSASEILCDLDGLKAVTNNGGSSFHFPGLRAFAAVSLALFLMVAVAFAYLRRTEAPSIGVLPIVNASGDAGVEYIANRLTEGLINRLSALPGLRVKPLTYVLDYKGGRVAPQEFGRQLKADSVLAAVIVREQGSLVLDARLINTADGSQVWGERYVITMSAIFDLQEDISDNIADYLAPSLKREEQRLPGGRGTKNREAFRQYIMGKYYWKNRTKGNIKTAIEHFNAAIKLDPAYARAYAGLSDCYVLLNVVSFGNTETKEAMTKAEAAAKQALEIDDTLPEAHASLGVINMRYHWRWQEAESRLQRAIALDPDYAPAHLWYSNLLTITGRRQEAVSQAEVAKDLDPFSPAATMNYCRAIYFARQYDRAAACFDKLIEEHPDYTHGKYARGYVYLQKGMYREAVEVFEELYPTDQSLAGAALGYAYGVTGRRDDALRVISEMHELSKSIHIPPQEIALVHFGLGDLDSTYLLLEQAAEQHFASFVYIAADPMFRRLHSDQKFIDLLRRFNLPLPQPEG